MSELNISILNRALGWSPPRSLERAVTTRQVYNLQHADLCFYGPEPVKREENSVAAGQVHRSRHSTTAHPAAVNAITVERFDGRYLLSGSSDSSIGLWDLEMRGTLSSRNAYSPVSFLNRTSSPHKFGITHVSFYPFDYLAFVTSSYDHTVKVFDTELFEVTASFGLGSVVHSHSLSPIATHLLIACATQHPAVRLVDLRSGGSTHSLTGHGSAILSVNWSPTEENVLASSSADGTVRLWDIRRASRSMLALDKEDHLGNHAFKSYNDSWCRADHVKAHDGAVNGVVWTEDGQHLVTVGHDEKIRVWSTSTGQNTLASFGPRIRNPDLSTVLPVLISSDLLPSTKDVIFFPNQHEILVYELFDGVLLKRLKYPTLKTSCGARHGATAEPSNRVSKLAWRPHDVGLYSGHADGTIHAWLCQNEADDVQLGPDSQESSEKQKMETLEGVVRDLTKHDLTFQEAA